MIDQVVMDIWIIADDTVGDLVIEIEGDHYFLFEKIRGKLYVDMEGNLHLGISTFNHPKKVMGADVQRSPPSTVSNSVNQFTTTRRRRGIDSTGK